MEKMKNRSAWMRIMAVMLTIATVITMMPVDALASNAKGSGAYVISSEAQSDAIAADVAHDHVHDDCDCGDCAHEDCDCEDHCGESHSCGCDDCSGHYVFDGVMADGAESDLEILPEPVTEPSSTKCNHTSTKCDPIDGDCYAHLVTCLDCGHSWKAPHHCEITGWIWSGTCECGLQVEGHASHDQEETVSAHNYVLVGPVDEYNHKLKCTRCGRIVYEGHDATFYSAYAETTDCLVCGYTVKHNPCPKNPGDHEHARLSVHNFTYEDCMYHKRQCPDCGAEWYEGHLRYGEMNEDGTYDCRCGAKLGAKSHGYNNAHDFKWVSLDDDICCIKCSTCGWVNNVRSHTYNSESGDKCIYCGHPKPEEEAETHTVTVNYVVPEGYTKPESKTSTGAKGEMYTILSPSIAGLTPDQTAVNGSFGDEDETFTVTYSEYDPTAVKDLSSDKIKVVGLDEDKDHKYTEKEVKRIGLEDETGKPLVKGKEFTEVISEKTEDGKSKWVIEYEPIEGKSKGRKSVEVEKPDPDKPKHNVTVHYTLPSPGNGVRGQSVAPTVVKSYYEGETYSIAAPKVAVPGKAGKYYRQSNYYVTGKMGKTDQEHTVIYEYSEQVAEVPFEVDVYYKVEAREGDDPEKPEDVKIRPLKNGDPYSITSPEVRGYYPDIKVVEGKIEGKNVVATVTYKPKYWASCTFKFPNGQNFYHSYELCDGGFYHFPVKPVEVFEFIYKYGPDRGMVTDILRGGYVQYAIENNLDAVWTPNPAETISGHIQGKDESFTVEYICSHPGKTYEQVGLSNNTNKSGTHVGKCTLCNADFEPEEACVFKRVGYLKPAEMNDTNASLFPAGAILYKCTKCDNFYFVDSQDDICPASSKDDPQPHLWGAWKKVSDTQCERTCARCKETITTGHVWGAWEYCTSKSHSRSCSLCHCTQTGDHGAWSNATVHKQATCIADAEVGATCGICNKQINNVYYGLVGSINPDYVRKGHDFTGGYARINGGHVQKCKACGAFDMEHHEAHAWSDWYATEGADSCTGERTLRRDCICGAYETKTEANSHNFVRDPARETTVTCESAGKECYTCTKCGEHNDTDVAALGHAWVEDEGNYPAKCGQEGRMWWHCANPGCTATKKDDCPAPSDHEWVPNWISKASCTREGVKDGEICSHCGEHRNEGSLEYVPKLNHDLETTQTLRRSGTYVSRTGNAAFDQEVWVVTNRCKTCGYQFPEAVYTVAKSGNLSNYKIEPGDVKITDMGDGIHVGGQFGKANAVYFNNTVNGAFKEVVDNLLNIYRQKEGSVITEFKPEFMNSLADGEYEMIHVNGDEISAATLTVKNHKFVTPEGAVDGKLPGIKALDESGVITETVDPDLSEKIVVNGQEVDYHPWMADGELLFYLGQIEDNAADVIAPDMGEGYTPLTVRADPSVTPDAADFDRREGSKDYADIVVIKCDKGHTFDTVHPISVFGGNLPATEEIIPDEEGAEKITRTNYVIAGDKVTFNKEYLATLGEGKHEIALNYEDGSQALFRLTVKGEADSALDETTDWNLFEDGSEHTFTVSGITSANEVNNCNAGSAKFFDAVLKNDTITVNLKAGADRKKAVAANVFDFDLGEQGTVSYTLPLTYSKPVLKLTSAKGTVKKGKETTLKTRVLYQTENANFVPFDLTGATLKYGTNTVSAGDDGTVLITASGKASGKLKITKDGWYEKDPVELAYAVAEVSADKDVLEADLGGLKQVTLNTKAPGLSYTFPLTLNGEDVTAADVTIAKGKKGEEALATIGNGTITFSLGESGVAKGSYTINLSAGKASCKIKVVVSDKSIAAAGKVKQKYDVVTKKPMVIAPTVKETSATITHATVKAVTLKNTNALPAEAFKAQLNGGNIEVDYVGEEEMTAKNLKIGDMTLTLTLDDNDGAGEPVEVDVTIKNVSAKKTVPTVKAAKVTIPKAAAEAGDGSIVIGSANLLSTYKDSGKQVRTITPVDVSLSPKNVEAELDPNDPGCILIKKLTGKSGSIKATLTFAGGVTKTVTIKVAKGK